jgi:endoglucanase
MRRWLAAVPCLLVALLFAAPALAQVPNGTYELINQCSGEALDVSGGSTIAGTGLVQYPWHDGTNQQWELTDLGNGYEEIANVKSGQVVDVSGASTSNGANVIDWPWHSGSNQEWRVTADSPGYYGLTNANSGKALGVYHASLSNGARIDQWTVNGKCAQEWQLTNLNAAPTPPPSNTAPPTISGTPQQGQTLTTTNGSWMNNPTFYAYQWQDCSKGTCQKISGATSSSYTLQASDVNDTVDVVVTASNSAGSASATSAQTAAVTHAPSTTAAGLHVVGNQLEDASGNLVRLHGVDRAGPEYACIQGWGFFDNSNVLNDDNSPPLIAAWHANEESVDLNEDCWLGINGVPSQYGGQNYINAIAHYVQTIEANHLHPVLNLQWSAPGTQQATGQSPMPDNDHSPAFWQSVADTFKSDPNVTFRLQEEPYPAGNTDTPAAWTCWRNGDVQYAASGSLTPVSSNQNCNEGYKTVGMQSLINIIRGTGATNVIAVPGVEYANSMTHFLDPGVRVTDTLNPPQLMGVVDVYPAFNTCGSTSCYDSEYAPVVAVMPFVFGEFGGGGATNCGTAGADALMSWADSHGAGYSAWSWDTWGGCNQLISSYTTGAPYGSFGNDYHNHLTSTFAAP